MAATPASGAIVINEVESQPTDFVELYNTGGATVDIGSYAVDDNSANPAVGTQIPGGTMIPANGFFVMNNPPGLGNPDEVHLYDAADVEIDSYSYADHALATYGRCPDGTGAFVPTTGATPGAANACPPPPPPSSVWPGGSQISFADGLNAFGANLSGLAYQASGSSAPGVLWATKNNPSTLYRLMWNGTIWTPDTANGWSAGKGLRYPAGVDNPDAEGVTLAGGDPDAVYVATERNDTPATEDTSRPAILRFDVSGAGVTLNATDDFDLTANLPGLAANGGLEAITWVPDTVLVAKGFVDENTGLAYAPGTYPGHGAGLFFVGVEQDGRILAYALNQATDSATRVATIPSGLASVMALEFETDTNLLWAACDNNCNGLHLTLDVAQSGPNDGKFVLANAYNRPAGMANLNNEGFAITPQAECVNGRKPVFWSEDSNADSHALRAGTLNCPGSGGGGGGGTADTTPPETKIHSGPKKKTTKAKAKFTFSANEAATFRCKLDSKAFAPCTSPATFKAKKGKHTLQVVATDTAGNADPTPASFSWKVKKPKR